MIDNDGDHSYSTVSQTVDFTAPGLYAVNLISFEDGGVTGVLWSSSIGAPSGGSVEVPESVLYQAAAVPEPTSLFLLGVGASFLLTVSVKRTGRSTNPASGIERPDSRG